VDKILELLMRLLAWAFSQPRKKEPRAAPQEERSLPDNLRKFVAEEVARARAAQPWGANELSMPPKLLTSLRAEILRQINRQPGPDPFAEVLMPGRLADQLRELIQQQLG